MPKRTWDADQDAILREHYPTRGGRFVAGLLGRTPQSVRLRAHTLGVSSERGKMIEIKDLTDQEKRLVNNLQNAENAMDKARAMAALKGEAGWIHKQIAPFAGIARSSVGRLLRLLTLDVDLQDAVEDGRLNYRHMDAVAVMGVSQDERLALLRKCASEDISQRDARFLAVRVRDTDDQDERARIINTAHDRIGELLVRRVERQIEQLQRRGFYLTGVAHWRPIFERKDGT